MPELNEGMTNNGRYGWGYIYIPNACLDKKCPVHIYYHGCGMSAVLTGSMPIKNYGFLEIAAANDIIFVSPQASVDYEHNLFACHSHDSFLINDEKVYTNNGV